MEIIKKAYDSNERQIGIVNSLLKVAQVDSGKVILRMTDQNVKELMESIIDDFRDTFALRKQTVELLIEDPGVLIRADIQHLRMALENLVSNASKYTYPYGSVTITVSQQEDRVCIAVADNGVGIAPKDIELLFEKFKRIPNDLSDEVGGTGLGLYWANKVVNLHRGDIEVESELNEGTTFKVYLPQIPTILED